MKKSHSLRTTITVREAWLCREAVKLLLADEREKRQYVRVAELAKLEDHFADLWSANNHRDYAGKDQVSEAKVKVKDADMKGINKNIEAMKKTADRPFK